MHMLSPIVEQGGVVYRQKKNFFLAAHNTPLWSSSLFERGLGEEGRFDVAARSETPNPPAKTTNSNCCDHAVAQVKVHKPAQPGWKYSKY